VVEVSENKEEKMTSPNDVFGLCALVLIPAQVAFLASGNSRLRILHLLGAPRNPSEDERALVKHIFLIDSIACSLVFVIHLILMFQFGTPQSIGRGILYLTQGLLMEIIMMASAMYMVEVLGVPERERSSILIIQMEMLQSIRRTLDSILSRISIPIVEERIPPIVNDEESPKEDCAVCFEKTFVELMPRYDCRCTKKLICENCLFTHLQSNGYHCPWCRQSITQVYTRVWGEPAEVDADAGGGAGSDASARGLESV